MSAPPRAILFDLYGVIGQNSWQVFKTKHFTEKPDDWKKLRALGLRVDKGEVSDAVLVDAIASATGESAKTVRYQFEHTIANQPLLDFIGSHLVGSYKIGLLSNASRDVVGDILSPEQRQYFDAVVSSFHVGLAKPDLRIFMYICDKMGVSPNDCLMVDDQPQHLRAAQGLGMRTLQYKSANQTIEALRKELREAV